MAPTLKTASDGDEMTDDGNTFHTRVPATVKAQLLIFLFKESSAGMSLTIAGVAKNCRQRPSVGPWTGTWAQCCYDSRMVLRFKCHVHFYQLCCTVR